jgi:hypothetical protein
MLDGVIDLVSGYSGGEGIPDCFFAGIILLSCTHHPGVQDLDRSDACIILFSSDFEGEEEKVWKYPIQYFYLYLITNIGVIQYGQIRTDNGRYLKKDQEGTG